MNFDIIHTPIISLFPDSIPLSADEEIQKLLRNTLPIALSRLVQKAQDGNVSAIRLLYPNISELVSDICLYGSNPDIDVWHELKVDDSTKEPSDD